MQRRPSDLEPANPETGEVIEEDACGSKSEQTFSLAVPGSGDGANNIINKDFSNQISKPLSNTCYGVGRALRSRVPAIRSGELLSIIFIRYTYDFIIKRG
jgi:hypothetical protein